RSSATATRSSATRRRSGSPLWPLRVPEPRGADQLRGWSAPRPILSPRTVRRSPRMSRNRKRRPAVPATVPQGFHFQWQGKGYTLPPASECHAKLSAGDLIDAVMDGSEMAQVRFGLSLLTAADIDKDTMAALRAMP